MNVTFSCYDTGTGEITAMKSVADETEVAINVPEGRNHVMGEMDRHSQYIDLETHAVLARPVIAPMTGASYDLSTLPTGSMIVVTDEVGVSTEVPAQADMLELTDAGSYRVRSISPFPWIDFDVEVVVP